MNLNADERFFRLVQSLLLLAADYSIQIGQFPVNVHIPDEIVSVFDECLLLTKTLNFRDSNLDKSLVNELSAEIDKMSKVDGLWTLESLNNDPAWERIRTISRKILSDASIKQGNPNLDWITFVRKDVNE